MSEFNEKCYQLLRQVPKGSLTTYKDLAHAIGGKGYRAVGRAMNQNPYAPKVPCHRVIKANGELGGFAQGVAAKKKMLEQEGFTIKANKILNWENHLHSWS